MVSTYGYTTLAELELYAHKDYSTIDATYLADAYVEAAISDAEFFINGYVGNVWTGTIPDDINLVTKMIAKIFIDNYMIEEAIGEIGVTNQGVIIDILERFDIVHILDSYKSQFDNNIGVFISKHVHTPRRGVANYDPLRWR